MEALFLEPGGGQIPQGSVRGSRLDLGAELRNITV
jgi:hypothetical protein